MRFCSLILLLSGWGWCSATGQADSGPAAAGPEQIATLVARLGSEQFADREAATQALDKLGPPALEALRQASQSEDVEIRRRSIDLLHGIEKRVESAQLLAPRRIRVVCKDLPVSLAVKRFAQQTGFQVQIDKPSTGLALSGRTITLDTGNMTFWEAYEHLCRQAGLVEELPRPIAQPAINPYGGNAPLLAYAVPPGAPTARMVSLVVGKPATMPTCIAGAVRVRVLPPQTPIPGESRGDGEALFALEVTPDPALQWHEIVGMRVTRAIDEHGFQLSQPSLFVGTMLSQQEMMNWVILDGNALSAAPVARDPRQVPVRLRRNKSDSKILQELSGTIAARVQTPLQPLITVENVLTATGRSFRGGHGGLLKVLDVQRQPNKQIKLQVRVEGPALEFNQLPGCLIGGGVMVQEANGAGADASQMSLQDARGQAYRLVKVDLRETLPNVSGLVQEFSLTYRPQREQGEPARLVFNGTRTATVDIPFTLRNVPLP